MYVSKGKKKGNILNVKLKKTYFGLAPNDCRLIADSGSYVNSRQNWWCRKQLIAMKYEI